MEKIKIAIIGTGLRGNYTYANLIQKYNEKCEIVAFVENKKGRRDLFLEKYNIEDSMVFDNINDFIAKEKMADAIVISNYDNLHYSTIRLALLRGYDILVETPVANSLDGLIHLKEDIEKGDIKSIILPAYNLRYSNFFNKLKEISKDKDLGELVNIIYNVDIGYEEFVHNYVRGNWRITSDTATIMLTNSCQDVDMLLSFANSNLRKISCFSDLREFCWDKFTMDMSENCFRCGQEEVCPYSAKKIYLKEDKFINKSVHIRPTKENLETILKEGPYGKCVFYCDNDVSDNFTSIMKFENNVVANFNINAFTKDSDKDIRLLFKFAEIRASFKDKKIIIKKFGEDYEKVINIEEDDIDEKLFLDFIDKLSNKEYKQSKSSIISSIDSHLITFAAEFANISESVVDVKSFLDESISMTKQIEETMFK